MRLLESVLELAGPLRCAGCGERGPALCGNCRPRLRAAGRTAPVPNVDRVLAAWDYEGAPRALVLRLKLRAARPAAVPLVLGMCSLVARRGLSASVLTWVPGRAVDIRRRGFDHSELLARELGARLGLPVKGLITRARPVPDQTGLGADARRHNLDGAFRADVVDGPVALIDDVVTTGATASACGLALKAAGATNVEVVASCRA